MTNTFVGIANLGISRKRAKTIVLPKPGKAPSAYQAAGGYRPIALLPTLEKVIESVVARKVTQAAEANGLLPDEQIGNRAHRSTITSLL